ncbi:hypothetical protein [Lentzea sp. E54]|uniref:hypothetical protein n=1 Tax=Lentzea xerophila TaxID=3435883 RepID=UPI003DA3507D
MGTEVRSPFRRAAAGRAARVIASGRGLMLGVELPDGRSVDAGWLLDAAAGI